MNIFSLSRTKQCAGCPWKKAVDPNTIPEGFKPDTHRHVAAMMAAPGVVPDVSTPLVQMQCHDSPDNNPQHCVGWLHNQLTVGNNIGVRVRMLGCQNITALTVVGQQRQTFDEILTDALAMNPELEKQNSLHLTQCPDCLGERQVKNELSIGWRTCEHCDGAGVVPADEADARDDAAEARLEAALNK